MKTALPQSPPERFAIPSWFVSALVHLSVLFCVAKLIESHPAGLQTEDTRTVGIVLKQATDETSSVAEDEAEESDNAEVIPPGSSITGETLNLLEVDAPSDPTRSLPPIPQVIGPGAAGDRGLPTSGQMTQGAVGGRGLSKGRARTGVFGVYGEGYKFVYVFDRSGSMGGAGHTALDAAKMELLKSLEDLGETHQFEIIFYNEAPVVMELAGTGRMVFGTPANKVAARQFVANIPADGATDHEEALLLALRLQPDVIFFLTDADEPMLTRGQLKHLREVNGGHSAIHTIEFGLGPSLGDENFLVALARQNGGQHVYFDVTRLRHSRGR